MLDDELSNVREHLFGIYWSKAPERIGCNNHVIEFL